MPHGVELPQTRQRILDAKQRAITVAPQALIGRLG